ncbi:MAG TPA: MFS transporter [Burkholderiales bacterium]|nr:MFS transporter [Burkholderiales bacterium]
MTAPARGRALAAFRIRSFRFQWSADLLTSWAFEMETLILGWYVLVATDSVFLLTVFGALQFVGTLLSPYIGMLADRISRRTLLMALRIAYAGCAWALTALEVSGLLATWQVFAIALVAGLLRPSDLVLRNALIADTVPQEQLTNAMGLSRTTMDSARIVGTLVGAGLFSSIGFGPAYVVVTAFYVASVALTRGVAAGSARRAGSAWTELRLGLRYVLDSPAIAGMMCFAFLVNLTAFPLSHGMLPYVAKDIYGTDANGLAHLMAAYAVGALAGSLALAWSGRTAQATRVVIAGIFAWYLLLLVFAFTETKAVGLALLVAVGLVQSLSMVSMSVALLMITSIEFRGRVMGLRMLAVYGLPLGLLAGGALIERIGFTPQAVLYAIIGLAVSTWIAWRWREALWRR